VRFPGHDPSTAWHSRARWHVAAKQGALGVENAFEHTGRRIDYSALPRITFTNPTIASAGITEAEAHAQGIECDCRVLGLENVPRAIVRGSTDGVVTLVAERDTGRVLGVHLLADGAGDAILAACTRSKVAGPSPISPTAGIRI
jgi:mercuric reductase